MRGQHALIHAHCLVLFVEWCPQAFVVSFKLETDPAILITKARRALENYGHSLVVANLLSTRKNTVTIVSKDTEWTGTCAPVCLGRSFPNPGVVTRHPTAARHTSPNCSRTHLLHVSLACTWKAPCPSRTLPQALSWRTKSLITSSAHTKLSGQWPDNLGKQLPSTRIAPSLPRAVVFGIFGFMFGHLLEKHCATGRKNTASLQVLVSGHARFVASSYLCSLILIESNIFECTCVTPA